MSKSVWISYDCLSTVQTRRRTPNDEDHVPKLLWFESSAKRSHTTLNRVCGNSLVKCVVEGCSFQARRKEKEKMNQQMSTNSKEHIVFLSQSKRLAEQNKQLTKSNQKVRATTQRLDEHNKQLTTSNRELRATTQRLDEKNKQFTTSLKDVKTALESLRKEQYATHVTFLI